MLSPKPILRSATGSARKMPDYRWGIFTAP
jgi:hypothetical protein